MVCVTRNCRCMNRAFTEHIYAPLLRERIFWQYYQMVSEIEPIFWCWWKKLRQSDTTLSTWSEVSFGENCAQRLMKYRRWTLHELFLFTEVTTSTQKYYEQLNSLYAKLKINIWFKENKWCFVRIMQRFPGKAVTIREGLFKFNYDVFLNAWPTSQPNLFPSSYHLFRCLENFYLV